MLGVNFVQANLLFYDIGNPMKVPISTAILERVGVG